MDNLSVVKNNWIENDYFSNFTKQLSNFPGKNMLTMLEKQQRIISSFPILNFPKINIPKLDFVNSEFIETLNKVGKFGEQIRKTWEEARNNPEIQFAFITDLEILNLKTAEDFKESMISNLKNQEIIEKEELLNKNLLPYLEELGIDTLWNGANQVLKSKSNPDKLRHCLISIRTILEYLINEKLAPIEKLQDDKMFENEFRKYKLGVKKIENVKISRKKRIEYFSSKFNFAILDEFTKHDIKYICDCYSVLCNIHQPDIGITAKQVRSLKIRTGVIIWLLAYLYKIMENHIILSAPSDKDQGYS